MLGFIHPTLTQDLKPTASDWRIGTLLVAAGCALFAANGISNALWLLPIANGLVFIAFALYLRSIRRYAHQRDGIAIFAPAVVGIMALTWFTFVSPNLPLRVAIATLVNLTYALATIRTLVVYRRRERSIASAFLIGLESVACVIVVLRIVYYATAGASSTSITATGSIIAGLTPLVIGAAPIVGTTAVALLCFERIRRDLHIAATTDALTGLANRRTINERAAVLFAKAREEQGAFSIAVIDIDHFKQVNDRFGHDAGDVVLKGVARVLDETLRGHNFVGRQGGEEFVVLFDAADHDEANAAADRLRAAVERESFVEGEQRIEITVSIGLAMKRPDDTGFQAILRRADRALYAAKDAGRNCVRSE